MNSFEILFVIIILYHEVSLFYDRLLFQINNILLSLSSILGLFIVFLSQCMGSFIFEQYWTDKFISFLLFVFLSGF